MKEALIQGVAIASLTLFSFLAVKKIKEVTSDSHDFVKTGLQSRSLRVDFPNSVVRKQRYFLNKDNLFIYWNVWEPEGECKGVVVLVHGFNSHCNRFHHVARNFNAKGFKVYGLDHQGHGMSEGDRMFVRSLSDFVDDVVVVIKKAKAENKGKKLIIFGHSMGGLIAIMTVLRVQSLLDAAIFSAPALYTDPANAPPALVAILGPLSKLFPKLRIQGLDISTLCRDKAVVDLYVNDPLVSSLAPTIRIQDEILKSMDVVNKRFAEIYLPILVLQGSDDKLCLPQGSKKLFKEVSSKDKTYKFYQGHYHELHNELPDSVEEDVNFALRIVSQ